MSETLNNDQLEKENQFLREENERLSKIIKALQKKLFGSGKNERIDTNQLLLELDMLQERINENQEKLDDVEMEEISYQRPKNKKPAEDRFPEDIKSVEEVIIPDEVRENPDLYEQIGIARRTETLDLVPAHFIKLVRIYPRFKRKDSNEHAPVVAQSVNPLVRGGIASARLMVHILISKYMDHLPLHRIESIFKKRYNVVLSRKSMSTWVDIIAKHWLSIIYYSIKDDLLKSDYLHADETPIKVRDIRRKGKCKDGQMWVYVNRSDLCLYDWQLGRGYDNLFPMLGDYEGYVQCDQHSSYQKLASKNAKVRLLACMAHVRRKFKEAWDANERDKSVWYLLEIKKLYKIERELQADGHDSVSYRTKHSLPILKGIKRKAREDQMKLRASKTLDGVNYLLNCYTELERYIEVPNANIDNNPAEQVVRPLKLGARNWLFVGHEEAGRKSAIIYTLIENCKRAGINPEEYLTDVLERLPKLSSNPEVIRQLQPQNWKPTTEI